MGLLFRISGAGERCSEVKELGQNSSFRSGIFGIRLQGSGIRVLVFFGGAQKI